MFYPVANIVYATQIAKDWNTKDEGSGFAIRDPISRCRVLILRGSSSSSVQVFKPHTVGGSSHLEYWIPAEQLPALNASIQGAITVDSAYFGTFRS
jgi:hypothetical protein